MSDSIRGFALVAAGAAFVLFLLFKLLRPLGGRTVAARAARERVVAARRRGADRSATAPERAAALREAALIALEDLRSPNLASSYARRAERLDPTNAESVGLVATTLRRASRFVALERLLWRKLADADRGGESYRRALDELISLYEGPLERPEVGRALRGLAQQPV
jgi:hypothetical protein